MLYNRFLAVRFKGPKVVIGDRQVVNGQHVIIPPTIEFEIDHTKESTPNEAKIRFFNVHPDTQRKLFVEGQTIEVEAGYWPQDGERNTGIIFKGQIRKVESHVDNGVDVISELSFGDSDDAANTRRAKKAFPRGTTHGDLVRYLGSEMAKDGVEIGEVEVPDYVEPRAIVIDGPVWRAMEDITHQHDLQWSIQDGTLNVIAADKPLRDKPVILSPLHGVLEAPKFTSSGVEIKTLMIHYLRPGHTFILRNDQVQNRAPEKYCIDEISFTGSNVGDDFGCEIKASVVTRAGKVKRSRDRQRKRRR